MLEPKEYFRRYGEHLADGLKAESAWLETERDFYRLYGLRRFLTYASFRDAHALHRKGHVIRRIVLHVCEAEFRLA